MRCRTAVESIRLPKDRRDGLVAGRWSLGGFKRFMRVLLTEDTHPCVEDVAVRGENTADFVHYVEQNERREIGDEEEDRKRRIDEDRGSGIGETLRRQ